MIGARLARHLKVSPPAVTEALQRMARAGYLRLAAGKQIVLTRRGLTVAEAMARRHRLLERWLTDILGLDWMEAHEEAHRLEHALSPRVEDRLAESLGMPTTCPHGNPIPGMAIRRGRGRFRSTGPPRGPPSRSCGSPRRPRPTGSCSSISGGRACGPARASAIQEVAPWAGTITATSEGRTIVLGLAAAGKIWVHSPK